MTRRLALLCLMLLAGCVDRGVCLRSHKASYWQATYLVDGKGNVTVTGGYVVEYDECDAWQFPNGRPK